VLTTAAWAGPAAAEPPAAAPVAQPAPAAPALTPEQAQAAATEARIVVVHLSSKERVRLDRRQGERGPWVEVCWSPCDTRTWADASYRVVGEGVMPSGEFSLPPANEGRVHLRVDPGSQVKRNVGIGLLIGGVALGVVGGVVTGLGWSGTNTVDGVTREGNQDLKTVGALLLAAGIGTGVGGAGFVLRNMATEVVPAGAAHPPPSQPAHGALPAAPTGVAVTLPLLSGSF
jgi:hypothetical protein